MKIVQVCDATMLNRIAAAGNKQLIFVDKTFRNRLIRINSPVS